MNKCLVCGDVVPPKTRPCGSPKLYCSVKCRNIQNCRVHKDNRKKSFSRWRKTERAKELYKKYGREKPEYKCHHVVRMAVIGGKLKRPENCSSCGETGRIHAHHPDYSKPLEVVWLCGKCHKETHRKMRGDK